jgi:hypothetical protein
MIVEKDDDVVADEQESCRQVVSKGFSGEVRGVEWIQRHIAADALCPKMLNASPFGWRAVLRRWFGTTRLPVEYSRFAGVREIRKDRER